MARKYRGLSEELIHTLGGSRSTQGKLTVRDLGRAFRVIALEALARSFLCLTQPPNKDMAALRSLFGSNTWNNTFAHSKICTYVLLLLTSPANYI